MINNLHASVLHLNRADCQALRITDPYSVHRVVYSLFSDVRSEVEKQEGVPSGIQYADLGGDARGRKILLLSNRLPADNVQGCGEVQTRALPANFLSHETYRFSVTVNPTRCDGQTKKLIPVRGREAIADWFLSRTEKNWGFLVDATHLQVERVDVLEFKDKARRNVTMAQAKLQGVLRVTDRELFQKSFSTGIGRGRAFGCGLLQIVALS